MKILIPILFIACLCFYSCRKDAKNQVAGLKTTVSGQFFDIGNSEAYTNLKIKIGEYKESFNLYGSSYFTLVKYIDSGLTDASGRYNINFTTTGEGSSYFMEFNGMDKKVSAGEKTLTR